MSIHDSDCLPGLGPDARRLLAGLCDASVTVHFGPPGSTHFYSLPTPRWHRRIPVLAAGAAYILAGAGLLVFPLVAPAGVAVAMSALMSGIGILATAVALAQAVRRGTSWALRRSARKSVGLVCTTGSPCPRCAQENQAIDLTWKQDDHTARWI